jgi:hypothetical protein
MPVESLHRYRLWTQGNADVVGMQRMYVNSALVGPI